MTANDGPARRAWPRPARPRLPAWLTYRLQRLLAPNPAYRALASLLERWEPGYRVFTATEKVTKGELFGCRMCGQCSLPVTGYACPMTCPKQLRNGPCGGVGADGTCEVFPAMRCVWVEAYERASSQGRTADLNLLQRPVDQRLWGRSSWVSYWGSQDEGLWADGGNGSRPGIWRSPRPVPAGRR
jgi:methylene-tetrahydrofolate reductase-like protein